MLAMLGLYVPSVIGVGKGGTFFEKEEFGTVACWGWLGGCGGGGCRVGVIVIVWLVLVVIGGVVLCRIVKIIIFGIVVLTFIIFHSISMMIIITSIIVLPKHFPLILPKMIMHLPHPLTPIDIRTPTIFTLGQSSTH